MLRNIASGPEIGLGRFLRFPRRRPAKIQRGRPISYPGALLRNIEYRHFNLIFYAVLQCTVPVMSQTVPPTN